MFLDAPARGWLETYHCQEEREAPHVEFASESIGGIRCDELDSNTGDEVCCSPERDVVCVQCRLSGLLVGNSRELIDEPLVRNDTANDGVGVTRVPVKNVVSEDLAIKRIAEIFVFIKRIVKDLQSTPGNHQPSGVKAPELPDTGTSAPTGVGRCNRGTVKNIFVLVLIRVEVLLAVGLSVAGARRVRCGSHDSLLSKGADLRVSEVSWKMIDSSSRIRRYILTELSETFPCRGSCA